MPPKAKSFSPRQVPRATLSENRVATPADLHDEEETVQAYIPKPPSNPAPIDTLISALDDPSRRDVVSQSGNRTRCVHGGERVRSSKSTKAILDALTTPIVQTATYTFRDTQEVIKYNMGTYESYEYGRYGNPTTRAAEEKIMALERAEDCLLSTSGMNAVTTMILALVPENGHIIVTTDCYRRTRQFVKTILPKMGITATVLDPADIDGLRDVLETKGGTMYFSELPTNPLLRVIDVPAITKLCRQHGVISVIDSTFATPVNFRPIEFGTDIVLHSGTKYLSGHQDVMCGALAGRADLVAQVRSLHGVLGGVVDPHAAFLVSRGIKSLPMRMEAHNRNSSTIARYLSTHPKVSKVYFPTIRDHIDYSVASRLFDKGFGGVLSFELKGNGDPFSRETFEAGGRFVDGLQIPYIGPSLGGCETIVEQVCIMGYFDQPLRERKSLGITNGLIRLACGIEDSSDLVDDIEGALRAV